MPPPSSWSSWSNTAFIPCGGKYSADFKCAQGSTCIPLASDYSATLCCPAGSDCDTINPISCDKTFWNATSSPISQVHAANAIELSSCGNACCPPSYTCNAQSMCSRGSLGQFNFVSNGNGKSATAAGQTRTQTSPLSTATLHSGSTTTPTTSITPNPATQNSPDSLNMTTKALISVLAALLLIIGIIVLWRYFSRRQRRTREAEEDERRLHYAPHYGKAELEGVGRRLCTPVCEMSGTRTPGELSARASVNQAVVRFPKELPAAYFSYYHRPPSINSAKRELDAWSLHGWKTVKDDWG